MINYSVPLIRSEPYLFTSMGYCVLQLKDFSDVKYCKQIFKRHVKHWPTMSFANDQWIEVVVFIPDVWNRLGDSLLCMKIILAGVTNIPVAIVTSSVCTCVDGSLYHLQLLRSGHVSKFHETDMCMYVTIRVDKSSV